MKLLFLILVVIIIAFLFFGNPPKWYYKLPNHLHPHARYARSLEKIRKSNGITHEEFRYILENSEWGSIKTTRQKVVEAKAAAGEISQARLISILLNARLSAYRLTDAQENEPFKEYITSELDLVGAGKVSLMTLSELEQYLVTVIRTRNKLCLTQQIRTPIEQVDEILLKDIEAS